MFTWLRKIDWALMGSIGLIVAAGLVMLASSAPDLFLKQTIVAVVGFSIAIIGSLIDIRPFVSYRWTLLTLFMMSILGLILVHILGTEVNGAKSWIDLGFFNLQPSEFAKVTLMLVLAAFFSRRHIGIRRLGVIAGSFAYFIVPALLILTEPDLGSALIFFGIWFGFLLVAGLPLKHILASLALFVIAGTLAWSFVLRDYQKERISAVFHPEADPLGVNYNVIQSKNAIGSAGIFGKGFKQGAIVQLGFLPAAQTDFAFASFTEEWGLLGATIVLMAFGIMIYRIAVIGGQARGNFYKFMCLGAIIFFGLHFMVNLGSVLGLLPVIGVVFPFLSYGGSNLLTSFVIIGIIQSIAAKTAV
ncbi:MAG: FtsW/RodA/SpoVE family cell cycle protein [Candidatus Colwellbacteria bacterium]|nr:FtsW/RodA/SpoVE family cell cycle protein [Candidatus Colwellbacteria bacterium]